MGFAPYGNARISTDFPKIWEKANKDIELFPERIDKEMMRLFAWCSSNNVPIMAHANPSKGPDNNSVLMGCPQHWNWAYQEMKARCIKPPAISFGHFGGSYADEENKPDWSREFAEILECEPDAYADLSYWESFLYEEKRPLTIEKLKHLFKSFPSLKQKLMYGTDWSMVSKEKGWGHYYFEFIESLTGVDDTVPISDLMRNNAAKFLGLYNHSLSNRTRLTEFYAKHDFKQFPQWFLLQIDTNN